MRGRRNQDSRRRYRLSFQINTTRLINTGIRNFRLVPLCCMQSELELITTVERGSEFAFHSVRPVHSDSAYHRDSPPQSAVRPAKIYHFHSAIRSVLSRFDSSLANVYKLRSCLSRTSVYPFLLQVEIPDSFIYCCY